MPKFSARSSNKLNECHEDLQKLFNEVVKHYDCSVLTGYRDQLTQDDLCHAKKSKLNFPNSKHNVQPSHAVDVVPYPIIWPDRIKRPDTYEKDLGRFYHFVGYVKAVALQLNVKIRCGADWNGNGMFDDQTFDDLPHWELNIED